MIKRNFEPEILASPGQFPCVAVLGIESIQSLQGHPALGASFEGWVIEQIIAAAPQGWDWHFLPHRSRRRGRPRAQARAPHRGGGGREILRRPQAREGILECARNLKPQRAFVVEPVRERYPLAERVQALPVLECSRVFE